MSMICAMKTVANYAAANGSFTIPARPSSLALKGLWPFWMVGGECSLDFGRWVIAELSQDRIAKQSVIIA
jgi:hypothetical protein